MNTLKQTKIYLADWVFVEKDTEKEVIVPAVITPLLAQKFIEQDRMLIKRALRHFGANSKLFLKTLKKNEDGSIFIKHIVFTKFLTLSNVQYRIDHGVIYFETIQVDHHTIKKEPETYGNIPQYNPKPISQPEPAGAFDTDFWKGEF